MKNEYRKRHEQKRLTKAVKERFPDTQKTLTNSQPQKAVQIDKNTIVLTAPEASTLQIRSRYE